MNLLKELLAGFVGGVRRLPMCFPSPLLASPQLKFPTAADIQTRCLGFRGCSDDAPIALQPAPALRVSGRRAATLQSNGWSWACDFFVRLERTSL
jgi:hypothetical protein